MPPTATFTATSPIDEGSSSTLSFTAASDPSSTDTTAGFHYSFACDGMAASLASTYASAGTTSSTTCAFADNGSYTVKGRIFDKDEGYTDYSATVVVNNVAPTATWHRHLADQRGSSSTLRSRLLRTRARPTHRRVRLLVRLRRPDRFAREHLRERRHHVLDTCAVRRQRLLHGQGHGHRQGWRLHGLLGQS